MIPYSKKAMSSVVATVLLILLAISLAGLC